MSTSQQQMFERILSNASHVLMYEDWSLQAAARALIARMADCICGLQAAARAVIPVQKLRDDAAAAAGDDECTAQLYVELHKGLLHWFVPAACGNSSVLLVLLWWN